MGSVTEGFPPAGLEPGGAPEFAAAVPAVDGGRPGEEAWPWGWRKRALRLPQQGSLSGTTESKAAPLPLGPPPWPWLPPAYIYTQSPPSCVSVAGCLQRQRGDGSVLENCSSLEMFHWVGHREGLGWTRRTDSTDAAVRSQCPFPVPGTFGCSR